MSSNESRIATSIPPLPRGSGPTRWWVDWKQDWKTVFRKDGLSNDVVAGATVACVALPLSMAIALASDVDPQRGLVTAIVGGLIASVAGSSRLSVTGPAAAMAVLIGQVVDTHGLGGLVIVTLVAGLLQILTGLSGLGSLTRLVPASVVHGFTAGIGVVILIGQFPRALGLPAPNESHTFDVIAHVGTYLHQASLPAAGLALLVALPMLLGPRISKRTPFALLGVAAATILAQVFALDVPRIGALPALTLEAFPSLPQTSALPSLFGDAFAVFVLASLETLLSVTSLDQLRPGERHDPNHELVGQGLGNLGSALVGGIPVTGVIARSALNVQSGARTRRAAIFHVVLVTLALLFARPILAAVPVAALGGVLVAVGMRMVDLAHLRELWRETRADAIVYVVTASVMIASDLLVGVQAGIAAACVVTLVRLTRTSVRFSVAQDGDPHQIQLEGSLTFLGAPRLDVLAERMREADPRPGCIVDTRHLDTIDSTGADRLVEAIRVYVQRGGRVVILGPNASVEHALALRLPPEVDVALTDKDADVALGRVRKQTARMRIAAGLARFQREHKPLLSPLLGRLAAGQSPHTMLITCADSRVVPSLITGSGPGEVFIVRNIGALLPPHGSDTLNDEGAALEYAIRVLGVRNLIICGHAKCGAVTALCNGQIPDELHALSHWLEGARKFAGIEPGQEDIDAAARASTLRQVEHLKAYPLVAKGLEDGEIQVEAWFYDVEEGDVLEYQPEEDRWIPLTS